MKFNLLPKVGMLAAVSFVAGGISTATAADPYDKALEARVAALERELNLMQGDDKGKAVKPADVPTFLRAKGSNVKELVMYGDLRYRWQYTNFEKQINDGTHDNQTSRNRYRLRFGFEYTLTDNFFMGFAFGSGADNGNDGTTASFTNGFGKQPVWIDKAYLGYKFKDIDLTIIAGKQNFPFYAIDDHVYNPADTRPEGFTESYKVAFTPNVKMNVILGQYIFFDNNEFNNSAGVSKGVKSDSYLSMNQFVFEFSGGNTAGTPTYTTDSKGVRTQVASSGGGTPAWTAKIGPSLQFYPNSGAVFTATANSNPINGINNVAGYGIAYGNATRDLIVFDMPMEFNFKLGGINIKPYAEITYNFVGGSRAYNVYGVRADHTSDKSAWMAGIKFGELKKKGDWAISVDWREVGIGSIDPNLNDPNWAASRLNMRGGKIALGYRFTNWLTGNINYYAGYNMRSNLRPSAVAGTAINPTVASLPAPGLATAIYKGTAVAAVPFDYNASQIVQIELNATF